MRLLRRFLVAAVSLYCLGVASMYASLPTRKSTPAPPAPEFCSAPSSAPAPAAFWGVVAFAPVPAFHIQTHDPVREDIYISGSVHSGTVWDPFIWSLLVRILHGQPPSVYVDVGANLGYYTLAAAAMGHTVIAFEPLERNAAKLRASLARNRAENVTLIQYVASDVEGHMQATHPTNQGNGRIVSGPTGGESVSTVTLTQTVHTDVLLMKIDVEGFETAVLQGALGLLCRHTVHHITIEFSPETRAEQRCSAPKMLRYMVDILGYTVSDVTPDAPPLALDGWEAFPPNILFSLRGPQAVRRKQEACRL